MSNQELSQALNQTENLGSQLSTNQIDSILRLRNLPGAYVAEVLEIIKSVRRGALLPQISTSELFKTACDWAETFYGIIPLEQLRPAYVAAKQNPNRRPDDRQFPIKDTEMLDAFYKTRAASSTAQGTKCRYCDLHTYDPTEYPRCPFHTLKTLNQTTEKKGLEL